MNATLKMSGLALGLWLGAAGCGWGAVYSFTGNGNGGYTAAWSGGVNVPDYDASGVGFGLDFGTPGQVVSGVEVSLRISGGWNGDLYAYLSHGNDYAVLLNRVGATSTSADGYGDKGFDVRLAPGGADPHFYQANNGQLNGSGQLTGTWGADGRVSYLDTDRSRTLDVFNGRDASGGWTLFLADLGSGGGVSKLEGWSVDMGVTAVPEPGAWGVGAAAGLAGICLVREVRLRWRSAPRKD